MTSPPKSAVIIGTGLIGTSIALALRESGTQVWLADTNPEALRLAAELGAGQPIGGSHRPGEASLGAAGTDLPGPGIADVGEADIAVLAMPPAAVARTLLAAQRQGLARCYTDVASVKQLPLREAGELGCDLASFVPGHPMSGRERSGPARARADLFVGQSWVICPSDQTAAECVQAVTDLVAACRAVPVQLPAPDHDHFVALVSHAPHLIASALAAQCLDAPASALALAGPGLRDMTRIAAGETGLWTEILAANAEPVSEVLLAVAARLQESAAALKAIAAGQAGAADELAALLEAGRDGVAKIPGKQGGPPPHYSIVQVVIGDRPGELARLFAAAGEAGINVEDVRIEHSPGLPVGVAELSVRPQAAEPLSAALAECGWPVTSPA